MNTRFRMLRKRLSHPALLRDERDFCSKKVAERDLSLLPTTLAEVQEAVAIALAKEHGMAN